MGTGELTAGGDPVMDWHLIKWGFGWGGGWVGGGGVGAAEILLRVVASCYRNWDNLWSDGRLCLCTVLTFVSKQEDFLSYLCIPRQRP